MDRRMILYVRRLYLIFVLFVVSGCAGQETGMAVPSSGQAPPTIPAEWLTRPPTPGITPTSLSIRQADVPNPVDTPTRRPGAEDPETVIEEASPPPTSPSTATPFVIPTQALPTQLTITAEKGVPEPLMEAARQITVLRPHDFAWLEPGSETADITLQAFAGTPIANWVYVVAAPFATVVDSLPYDDVQNQWNGSAEGDMTMIVSQSTADALAPVWGAADDAVVRVESGALKDALWEQRPSLTVLPFDQLTPELKAMQLDGVSPLSHDFSTEEYPLVIPVGVTAGDDALRAFISAWSMPATNRDPSKLTRVAMTGVTALVRATASQMETDGVLTAGEDVRPVLQGADIAHISNEVSFAEDCPEPNPVGGTTFCSQDDYFALLEDLGTDVVELTGNHLNDWGPEAFSHTMNLYEAAGMKTFGGGLNLLEAAQPAVIEHNGNRIAFVGCNVVGPNYAWAGPSNPGSQPCSPEFEQQVRELADAGYFVIVTQQYYEFYHYQPTGLQVEDFRALVDAGATAVSGSQGHHAQGFDLYNGAFIHFGLGNLFFDQMDMLGTRQSFVDTYAVYDGKLKGVELWTGLIEDYYKPRLMTAEEREEALQMVFEASGW